MRRSRPLGLLFLLSAVLGLAPVATAREGDETLWVELGAYRTPPAVGGPSLLLGSDARDTAWYQVVGVRTPDQEGVGPEGWVHFGEPPLEGYAVSADELLEVVRAVHSQAFDDEIVRAEATQDGIAFNGPAEELKRIDATVRWWLAGLAPARRVTATLQTGSGEARLLGHGGAELWPNRWTTLANHREETPLVASWHIEIAQESTSFDPQVTNVPEGYEVYARYHPGEERDLIEIWAGWLSHEELFEIDLSSVHVTPESNALATVVQPRTAGYRIYTVFPVAHAAARRVVSWNGPAGPVWLTLDVGAAPEASRPLQTDGAAALPLRLGAVGGVLEFEVREAHADEVVERLSRDEEEGGFSLFGTEIAVYEGSPAGAERARAALARDEAGLEAVGLTLRALTVPEATLRGLVAGGTLSVGGAVPQDALSRLLESGGVETLAVSLPALEGADASFRVGECVTGLEDFESEVAQQSGGLAPASSARFSGLSGTARVLGREGARRVQVEAALSWASARASRIELAFRPPVGMGSGVERLPSDSVVLQRAHIPVLGASATMVDVTAPLPESGEVLLSVVPRGEEVVLLLARMDRLPSANR